MIRALRGRTRGVISDGVNRIFVPRWAVSSKGEIRLPRRMVAAWLRQSPKLECKTDLQVAYHPGFACNLSCQYCYQATERNGGRIKSSNNPKAKANKDDLAEFILHQACQIDAKEVALTVLGGEPLLYGQDIQEFVAALSMRIPLSSLEMITNASLLTSERLKWFIGIGGTGLQITLDGYMQDHDRYRYRKSRQGTYSLVLAAISRVALTNLSLTIRINVKSDNIDNLPLVLSDLKKNLSGRAAVINFALIDDTETFADKDLETIDNLHAYGQLFTLAASMGLKASTQNHLGHCVTCVRPKDPNNVNNHGLVLSSDGQLYSCWDSAGQEEKSVGDIWRGYDESLIRSRWVQCGYQGGRTEEFKLNAEDIAILSLNDSANLG